MNKYYEKQTEEELKKIEDQWSDKRISQLTTQGPTTPMTKRDQSPMIKGDNFELLPEDEEGSKTFHTIYEEKKNNFYPQNGPHSTELKHLFVNKTMKNKNGELNVICPISVQYNDNYGDSLGTHDELEIKTDEYRKTDYLQDTDWDQPGIDKIEIKGQTWGDYSFDIYISISKPNNSPHPDDGHKLVVFFPRPGVYDVVHETQFTKNYGSKDDIKWLHETAYVVSISYESNGYQGYTWAKRFHPQIIADVLAELAECERFQQIERRFIVGHGRGALATLDALIIAPKFSNNIILATPYFQQKPGARSNTEQILFDHLRQEKLLTSINSNNNLRIQVYVGEASYTRNASYALCFWLKGNMENVQICEIKNGSLEDTFIRVFGGKYKSSLRQHYEYIDRKVLEDKKKMYRW